MKEKLKNVLIVECDGCEDCRFSSSKENGGFYCSLLNKSVDYKETIRVMRFRMNGCPLILLTKITILADIGYGYTTEKQKGYQKGWNDCIDAILGETE